MSFTLNNSNSLHAGAADTTIAQSVTGVAAGDLVVVYANCAGDPTSISVSDGTSSFTGGTYPSSVNVFGRMFYLLASVATGSVTYTATFGASVSGRDISIYVFTPSAAVTFDTETAAYWAGTAVASGGNGDTNQITTTGTDELVLGAAYMENTLSSPLINALAATATVSASVSTGLWYRAFASTFTGSATCTQSSSGKWICHVMAFKITAAPSVKRAMMMGLG